MSYFVWFSDSKLGVIHGCICGYWCNCLRVGVVRLEAYLMGLCRYSLCKWMAWPCGKRSPAHCHREGGGGREQEERIQELEHVTWSTLNTDRTCNVLQRWTHPLSRDDYKNLGGLIPVVLSVILLFLHFVNKSCFPAMILQFVPCVGYLHTNAW